MALLFFGGVFAAGYLTLERFAPDHTTLVSAKEYRATASRWSDQSFRVTYRFSNTYDAAEIVWYHAPGNRTRIDLSYRDNAGSKHERVYIDDGGALFSCREPDRCATGVGLFDDRNNGNLDGIITGFLVPISSTATADPTAEADLTPRFNRSYKWIASAEATCFGLKAWGHGARVCFSDDDIPVFYSPGDGPREIDFEATAIVRDVTAADFAPPYPISP